MCLGVDIDCERKCKCMHVVGGCVCDSLLSGGWRCVFRTCAFVCVNHRPIAPPVEVDVSALDIRVGKIISCAKHPDAEVRCPSCTNAVEPVILCGMKTTKCSPGAMLKAHGNLGLCIFTSMRKETKTHVCTHKQAYTHMYTHTYTHKLTHTHTITHTLTHIHTHAHNLCVTLLLILHVRHIARVPPLSSACVWITFMFETQSIALSCLA
jgi:hypothetical protein